MDYFMDQTVHVRLSR